MMKQPLVSVLMTAYNREKYIAEAIDSVLCQTYTNWELIIVDDGSRDNTLTVAKAFESNNSKIKVYENEKNIGQFANRNKAAQLAKGEFLKYLDSDDLLKPNALEMYVCLFSRFPNAGILIPPSPMLLVNGQVNCCLDCNTSLKLHFNGSNHLSFGPTAVMYRSMCFQALGGYEPQFGILTDVLFNLKVACRYNTLVINEEYFVWRIHDEQVTVEQKQKVKMVIERYLILEEILNYEYVPLNFCEIKTIKNKFNKINFRHVLRLLFSLDLSGAIRVYIKTKVSIKSIIPFN